MREEVIRQYLKSACPVEISGRKFYGLSRLPYLAQAYPELAADTILHPQYVGWLEEAVSRELKSLTPEEKVCQTLIEMIFNLVGLESKRVGFSEGEVKKTLQNIVETLKKWDAAVVEAAYEKIYQNMKKVNRGDSLAAKMAENIDRKLDIENLVGSFVRAVKEEVQGNVYYQMALKGLSKFGNDSATGLRVVRHFDFVQVSSNPVIAARAYEEFPDLWLNFREIIETHPEWLDDPERYGDEIALHGTITSLLPSLLVFRPIALLSDFHAGMVSYQLNPFKATSAKESIEDAEKICSVLSRILYHYDAWLDWNPDKYRGRPNIVFKVAACHPAAIDITVGLNRRGIGSNNTVTYSVPQEMRLLIAEAEGMALALKKGILPTQVYQTNMIGRTEDHLREVVAESLVSELSDKHFEKLAQRFCPEAKGSREERTKLICSKKHLKRLDDEKFSDVYVWLGRKHFEGILLEAVIKYSGIYVTRKVYNLFFSPRNRLKWRAYLQKKFDLSVEEAETVLSRIDMLPASKRRAADTYLVLGTSNVTNTEFPNQQLAVWEASLQRGFELERQRDTIKREPATSILERLLKIDDFVKIYELTPDLARKLKEVGIEGEHGRRGMRPEDWPNYGAVQKTMREFMTAYLAYEEKAIEFVKKSATSG